MAGSSSSPARACSPIRPTPTPVRFRPTRSSSSVSRPKAVLLGIAAGGSLFGFVGTFLAVPFLAVALNVLDEVRRKRPADAPTAVRSEVEEPWSTSPAVP